MSEQRRKAYSQRVSRQTTFEIATGRNRDLAGLFGYDNRNRVVFLGEAERGAVAGAEIAAYAWIDRQRQKACGRRNAIAPDDDRPVVQRRGLLKNAGQQVVGDHRVEWDAALDVVAKTDLPFEHDDRA